MTDIATNLIHSCEELNNLVDKKMISRKTFTKVFVDIDDLKKIEINIVNILNEMSCNGVEEEEVNTRLASLHFEVSDLAWYFGEVRELLEPMIGCYRKLVREQGYTKD